MALRFASLLLAAVCAVAFVAADLQGRGGDFVALKVVPALVLAALQLRARPGSRAGLVAAGLVASAVGDASLELDGGFLPGLVAFLVGHLAYTAAFTLRAPVAHLPRALPFAVYGAAMFLFLRPGLGGLAAPVAAYVAVICAMAWRAAATVGALPRAHAVAALLGAVTFVASDSILAVNKFHGAVPGATVLVLGTYWLGQLGIAASTGALARR